MKYYRLEHLEQDTDNWRQWRRRVIGGTDAPIIMGENRWKGRESLINEKLGLIPGFAGNAATQEGKELEIPAREETNRALGVSLQTCVIQSTWSPYLAASLDGVDESKNIIVEIKSGVKTYEHVESRGSIPSHYLAQLQHILMVSRSPFLYFVAYRPTKKLLIIKVNYEKSYIDELHAKEQAFAKELSNRGHKLQGTYLGKAINFDMN